MTTSRSEAYDHLAAQLREAVERWRLHATCLSCQHFDEDSEGCGLAGGARPPARVIASGCDRYEENVPF